MEPLRIGIIGCGNISGIYLNNLTRFPTTKVLAVADLDAAKATEVAAKYGLVALTPEQLLADPTIELVVNLTVPRVHFEVNLQALDAKKHVYVEKPLALSRKDGARTMIRAGEAFDAQGNRLLVGAAPDTFLGAGLQLCRQLIDEGAIGKPIGFNAFMLSHGPEDWHPNPEFYYQKGGGPLFDMGPYYLTALVSLLGPVKAVNGLARASFKERRIGSEPKKGAIIDVETPTHIVGLLEFEEGAIGQITTSFDVWHSKFFNLEIYGTEGSLGIPDPNNFDGQVFLRKARQEEWEEVPNTRPYSQNSRGLGVLDMAYAIRTGRPHRASGRLALHVLDIMESILESSEKGERVEIANTTNRPAPLPATLPVDDLDG